MYVHYEVLLHLSSNARNTSSPLNEAMALNISLYVLQFVLVLDDGVADVKREDLHIF